MDSPMQRILRNAYHTRELPEGMQKYTRKIEDANTRFREEMEKLAEEVTQEVIIPVCRKHRLRFWSDMGAFGFYREGSDFNLYDEQSLESAPKALRRDLLPVVSLLWRSVDSKGPLGLWLPDFDPLKKERKTP